MLGALASPGKADHEDLEKSSEKMQLFSKPGAGLRRQRSLLQKLKRVVLVHAQVACNAWCVMPRWPRGAQSMALAQDKELVCLTFNPG